MGTGFFEELPQVGKILEEHDTRLWPMISKYVEKAHAAVDMSEVTVLGMDETSKKGHNYITVFADIQRKVTLDVQPGKDATTVGNFVEVFTEHNGIPNNVQVVTADTRSVMSSMNWGASSLTTTRPSGPQP